MDLRQKIADAAADELRRQLDAGSVDQMGTFVWAEGGFRMARVAKAIIRVALDISHPYFVEQVARGIGGDEWEVSALEAQDAIQSMKGALV